MEFRKTIKNIAYWAFITAAVAYAGLETFCDRVTGETFKEKTDCWGGVVWVREQERVINPLTLYRVTAFKGNEKIYDSISPLKSKIPGMVEKGKKALENVCSNE